MDIYCLRLSFVKILVTAFISVQALDAYSQDQFKVTEIPTMVRQNLKLSEFYQKRVTIEGFSIVSSSKVSDFALKEAAYLIAKMTRKHPNYLQKLAENKGVNASDIIKELSLLIDGSGGGQTFYATGGGTNLKGISSVISRSSEIVNQM